MFIKGMNALQRDLLQAGGKIKRDGRNFYKDSKKESFSNKPVKEKFASVHNRYKDGETEIIIQKCFAVKQWQYLHDLYP